MDHTAVLRLLADRHHDLTGPRTQAICRLHASLCRLTPGGAGRLLSAQRAGLILRSIHPGEPGEVERKRIAAELLSDVRRLDSQHVAVKERIVEAVLASGTTVTDIHGIGPLGAAIILGHTGDIARSRPAATSPATPAPPPSPRPAAPNNGTGSTLAATGNSTGRCTSPR